MEHRIQYARTTDGVSLAYSTVGAGLPLVLLPALPFSHIELEQHIFRDAPAWYARLGRDRQLVRYDARGTGLSDRGHIERDLDSMVLDLEAVVDVLRLERFALQGTFYAVPVAIAYAVRHPERVSHLITFCGFARFADLRSPQLEAVRSLITQDWNLYSETAANVLLGWEQGPPARRLAEFIRDSVTPESLLAIVAENYDVVDLLPKVQAPTLVQYRREIPWLPIDVVRTLASGIPDARLEILEGTSIAMYLGDTDSILRGIDAFLGDRGPEPEEARPSALRVIIFTDLPGHTDLVQRLGDARGRELLREHERITRASLDAFDGTEIKSMGDGFLASFASAQSAMDCAVNMQRAFERWNQEHGEQLLIRIGANAGEPIAEDDDLFGESVIAASRIASRAEGGEILISNVVRELVAGKGFRFEPRGEEILRGFDDPVRLFALRWR